MAKFTELELKVINELQQERGITRKAAVRLWKKSVAALTAKFEPKSAPKSQPKAPKKKATTPAQKLTPEEAGKARSVGVRLYIAAGRPTPSQFLRVFGKDGAKMTWEQRAAHAGIASAKECAARFQELLAAKTGKSAAAAQGN